VSVMLRAAKSGLWTNTIEVADGSGKLAVGQAVVEVDEKGETKVDGASQSAAAPAAPPASSPQRSRRSLGLFPRRSVR